MPKFRLPAGLLAASVLAGCATPPPGGRVPYQPSPDMEAVLREYQVLRPRPADELTTEVARRQPQLIDAARAVRNVQGLPYPDEDVPRVIDLGIPGAADRRPARLFAPEMTKDTPVVLLFPGGGWVAPTLDASDAAARALSNRTGAMVLMVQPRGAPIDDPIRPENARFPAAHEDALATYRWLQEHAREYGGDPSRIVLAGEGTGGGLALATAVAARDRGLGGPAHLLLLTPMVGLTPEDPALADARPVTRDALRFDQLQYAPRGTPPDPRLDPGARAELRGLPPATLVLAPIDSARPGAELLAARLAEAGVPVVSRTFEGTAAGFFGLGAVVSEARQAQDFAAGRLEAAFYRPPAPQPARPARRR